MPVGWLRFSVFFALVLVAANLSARAVCETIVSFDCPAAYPLSVYYPRLPSLADVAVGVVVVGVFVAAWWHLRRVGWRLWVVIGWGIVLVLGGNLTQGWDRAFAVPIAGDPYLWTLPGDGIEYYHDALEVSDPLQFIRDYTQLQPDLRVHAKSHPPGAVLTFYLLAQLSDDPAAIGIMTAVLAVSASAFFFYGIVREGTAEPGYAVWLFLLLPSVQIYYAACLDALIAPLLLGGLYFFLHPRPVVSVIGAVICLGLAASMTFAVTFMAPVLVSYMLIYQRGFVRLALILLCLVIVGVVVNAIFGFNYIESFQIAAALENPDGFRLLAEPVGFGFTRLENLLEIGLFFSPVMLLLAWRGRTIRDERVTLAWVGVVTLLAMFATGAFRTGETARACLFIVPYLVFPALLALSQEKISDRDRFCLAALVFGQSLIMQLTGGFFW